MWCSAPARVGEPDRREPRLGLLAGERVAVLGQRRDRREQRPVEQPLVQGAHGELGVLPGLDEPLGRRRDAGRPREHAQGVLVARHEVRAAHAARAAAGARAGAGSGSRGRSPPPRRGRCSRARPASFSAPRVERSRTAGVGLPVHELQQLDRELDVAQAARPELQLDVDLVRRDVLGDALAHPLHRVDEALARRARPDERRHPATYRSPSSRSPASGRAFSSAWNSQLFAHRS